MNPSASHEEVRQAYIERALRHHPDRHQATGETDQVLAARQMQEANEAWAVLGDPVARAAYDAEQGLADEPLAAPADRGGDASSAWRLVPVAIVLAVLLAIFVFTAYARTPG